jgi:hypothetical protein
MLTVAGIVAIFTPTEQIVKKEGKNGCYFNFETVTRQRKDESKTYYYRKASLFVPTKDISKANDLLKKGQMIQILKGEWRGPTAPSTSEIQNKGWHSLNLTWYDIAFLPYKLNEKGKPND